MFSAKHILEENEDETRYRIASSQAIQFDRETPPAENRTWNKLWDEILGSNITADDSALDLDLDGEWGNGFNNVDRGIETWAAKSLQSLQNQCPTETLIDNVQQKDASLTCYGMVSNTGCIRAVTWNQTGPLSLSRLPILNDYRYTAC